MARHSHPIPHVGFAATLVGQLLDDALAAPGTPPVYGITGVQGSGKSTLAAQLVAAAKARGLRATALSIDDFYLGRRERQALGRRVHPLLATRGPPGTHDVALACRTLDLLRRLQLGGQVSLPRFDKASDRRLSPSRWPTLHERPDLIVFEGWFLKVPPESADALQSPLNALEREQDPDGIWRKYCNRALAGYQPLWQRLDRLLWLRAPGFEVVPKWRGQAETALRAAHVGQGTMTPEQLGRFVQFFERVSRQGERTLPAIADRIVVLDRERRPRT
jgi:D-glycerate 3-kinase